EVERAQGSASQLFRERLDADAGERRQSPCGQSRGHLAGRGLGVAVLLRIRAVAVAVLEVGAEILDGLAAELLADAGVDRGGEVLPQSDRSGEVRRSRGIVFERLQSERSQPGR